MSRSNRFAEAWLGHGGSTELTMRGHSMSPALRDGDRLTVAPVAGELAVGDIVLMRWRGDLVTHRVIALADGKAVTRGDACCTADPPLPVDEILGRVVAVQRRGFARLFSRLRLLARPSSVRRAGMGS
jgi:hypothetical protein